MNRPLIVSIAVAVVIIVIILAFLTQSATSARATTTPPPATSPAPMTTATSPAAVSPTVPTMTTSPAAARCPKLTMLSRDAPEILSAIKTRFLASDVAKRYGISEFETLRVPIAQWPDIVRRGEADLIYNPTGAMIILEVYYRQGLLSPLEGEEVRAALRQVPMEVAGIPTMKVVDGKVYWAPVTLDTFGVQVNKAFLGRLGISEPRSWRDLASLEYAKFLLRGVPVVAVGDPSASGTMLMFVQSLLQFFGWDEGWAMITLMAANGKVIRGGGAEIRDAMARGEVGIGWNVDNIVFAARIRDPNMDYVLLDFVPIDIGLVAVTAGTRCREAAEAFVAWFITEGQVLWFDPTISRPPINPNAFDTDEGRKRQDLKAIYDRALSLRSRFNATLAASVESVVMYYFAAAIRDNQDVLQEAWKRIADAYFAGKVDRATAETLAKQLGSPITFTDPDTGQPTRLTLEYAQKINPRLATDPAYRDKVYAAWRDAARAQYQKVLSNIP